MKKHLDITKRGDTSEKPIEPVKSVKPELNVSSAEPTPTPEITSPEAPPTTPLWVILLSLALILVIVAFVYYFVQTAN